MRRRLQGIILTAIILLTMMLLTAGGVFAGGSTSGSVCLGSCGANSEAWLVPKGGGVKVLQIRGEGAVKNYGNSSDTPWYGQSFVAVQFEEGITSIGSNTFTKGFKRVYIPSTVTSIKDNAFTNATTIETVIYGDMRTKWNALKSKHNTAKNKPLFECKTVEILVQPLKTYDLREGDIPLTEWHFGMLSRSLRAAAQDGKIRISEVSETKTRFDLDWNGVYDIQMDKFSDGGMLYALAASSTPDFLLELGRYARNPLFLSRLQFASQMWFKMYTKPKIDINTATIEGDFGAHDYTGTKVFPEVTLRRGSTVLKIDQDYMILGDNTVGPGVATMYIYGIGNYNGCMTLYYTITESDIGWPKLTLPGNKFSYTYTGSAIKPVPKLVYEGWELIKGRDYKLEYKNCINAGDAKLIVYGLGGYTGSRNVTYKILPKAISPDVSFEQTEIDYDGSVHDPVVTVKDGSKEIWPENYTLNGNYRQKTNVGAYTVTAVLKNNYSGSGKATYKILPPPTAITKIDAITSKGFTVHWQKKTAQVKGYQVQVATDSKFKTNVQTIRISDKLKTSYTFKNLKPKTTYYVRVRTYLFKDPTYFNSRWSKSKLVTTQVA